MLTVAALTLALSLSYSSPASPVATEGGVELEALDGTVTRREVAGLALSDPREQGAWLVRFTDAQRRPSGAPAVLELTSGDRLYGEVTGGEGEDLRFRVGNVQTLTIPVDRIERLVYPGRIPPGGAGAVEPAEGGDRMYRARTGGLDPMDGTVEEFSDEGVLFDGVIGLKLLPWDEVAALFVEPFEQPEAVDAEGVPVIVDLVDQSRLRGHLVELSRRGCRMRTIVGEEILLPQTSVAEVIVADGRIAFLSDFEAAAADEGSPFGDDLGMRWPHRRDRSVSGSPLTAGARIYGRGIGVHAPSRLTYDLGGEWKSLRGRVAVDDEVLRLSDRGSVVFAIRVDEESEPRWKSPLMRGGDAPVAIPAIDVSDAASIVLEVETATDFFVADRADWLRLVVVR